MDDRSREQPWSSVALREITNLTLEGDGCKWQFEANGMTVRLRARSEQEANSWFASLQAGRSAQVWVGPAGGHIVPLGMAEQAVIPEVSSMDVLVQVEKLFGLPRGPMPAQPSFYLVRARWHGHQGSSRTDERQGRPGTDGNSEDCVVKQQLKLAGLLGVHTLIVSVFRRTSDAAEDVKLVGICRLDANDPAHCTVQTHPLTDEGGRPTGTTVRLRLRPKPQAGAILAEDAAGTGMPGRRQEAESLQDSGHEQQRTLPPEVPAVERPPTIKAGQDRSQSWAPGKQGPRLQSGNPRPISREPRPQEWLTERPQQPREDEAPESFEVYRGDQSLQNSGRFLELHAEHEARQKKMQVKRASLAEEERRRMAESRESVLRTTRKGMLHPQGAANRLFRDHEKRLSQLQLKREEQERQELEARMAHSCSASQLSVAHVREVSERLHREHERREQEKQVKKSMREAAILSELEKASVGAGASYNSSRHLELYENAKFRREMLDRRRKDVEDAEMRKFGDKAAAKRSGPVDSRRLNALYMDHKERQQRQAVELAKRQMLEEEMLKEAAAVIRHKTPPRKPRRGAATLSFSVQNVDRSLLSAGTAALASFRAAISEVVSREAGETPEQVELREGHASGVLLASVLLPGCANPRMSASRLAEALTGGLAEAEGLPRTSAGTLGVSDVHVTEEKAPLWPSCYKPKQPEKQADQPQEPSTAKRTPVELSTQVDVALAAVVAAIQTRCGYGQGPSPAELKGLAVPLKAVFAVYKEALGICEKGEGYAQLCLWESRRLFLEGNLLPESEGWRHCCEPDPIRQVEDALEGLLATARAAQAVLEERVAPNAAAWPRGAVRANPGGVKAAMFACNPGTKPEAAAVLKSFVRFQPASGRRRYQHLLDLARLTVVFSSCEMLQAGLDHIIETFEVVDVRNYFAMPQRLGNRFVEVLLVVNVKRDGDLDKPHVCELRLEELSFHRAREAAAPHLVAFADRLRGLYDRGCKSADALVYLARLILESPQEVHGLRQFRRHLARRFGSTVGAWRRGLGTGRLASFERFREVCQALKCREHAPEFWSEIDLGRGSCVSLFELDPEAVSLLVKLRTRILMLAQTDDVDQEALFARLTARVPLTRPGQLEVHEFRAAVKAFGIPGPEADRLFSYLDPQGGSAHSPPAHVGAADIDWLRRLPSLVDVDAVLLSSEDRPTELEAARSFNLAGTSSKRARSGGTPTWRRSSVFDSSARRPSQRSDGGTPRARSQEPPERARTLVVTRSGSRGSMFDLEPARAPERRTPAPTRLGTRGSLLEAELAKPPGCGNLAAGHSDERSSLFSDAGAANEWEGSAPAAAWGSMFEVEASGLELEVTGLGANMDLAPGQSPEEQEETF